MTVPTDVILAFHNAFRRDMAIIDAAALELARGTTGREAELQRYHFMNEILVWHADGEELAVFPAVEKVSPAVAEAYEKDHRGLDAASAALDAAVSAGDGLQAARASAALKFHLDLHLAKEDSHLYRLFRERIPLPEQGQALGMMSSKVPPARFPEAVGWLFPLLADDDRENVLRIWQMVLPAETFAGVTQLVRGTIADGWPELTRRMPELAG